MKKFMGLVLVVAVAIAMVGCSQSSVSSVSSPAVSLGSVDVVLNLGKTGMAKTSSVTPLSLDSVVMNLTATGEAPIHSVTPVSGNAQTVVAKSFDLAPKTWSLTVTTYAMRYYPSSMPGMPGYSSPQIVHQGSTTFTVSSGTNPAVNLSISSQYSMLLIRVTVPDSCNQVTLYSGDSLVRAYSPWADTLFTMGSLASTDTMKMIYNWLYVQTYSQYIQIAIKGRWAGVPMVLYWGNLLIPHVTAGADTSYSTNLNWQGPSSVLASQSVSVTAGAVGLIVVDGKPIKP